jgi:hypothetical protein
MFIGDDPPASPIVGQTWWESDTGNSYIYYNDGNSSQWVPSHVGVQGPIGPQGPAGAPGPAGANTMAGLDAQITDGDVVYQTKNATLGALTANNISVVTTLTMATAPVNGGGTTASLTLNGGSTKDIDGATIVLRGATATVNPYCLEFRAGGSERMRVAANGNVGIGLTVDAPQMLSLNAGNISFENSVAMRSLMWKGGSATYPVSIGGFGNSGILTFSTSPSGVNGVERMRIDNAGNVGIGTTAPATLLHVDGNYVIDRSYGSVLAAFVLDQANGTKAAPTAVNASRDVGYLIGRGYDGAAYQQTGAIGFFSQGAITPTSAPGYITFYTTPAGSINSVERMRLTSAGTLNLGIVGAAGVATATPTFMQFTNEYSATPGTPGSCKIKLFYNGTDTYGFAVSGNTVESHTPAAGQFTWYMGGVQKLNLNNSGELTQAGPSMVIGGGITTEDAHLEIGGGRAGNGYAYIDFHGQPGTDQDARIIREPGADGSLRLSTTGNGNVTLEPLGSGGTFLGAGGSLRYVGTAAAFGPVADNAQVCGWSSTRWSVVYAVSGAINTSDEREKLWRGPLTDVELAAAKQIAAEIGIYQWLDGIEKKGADKARVHCGVRAQRVWAIMAEHGLVEPIGEDGKPGSAPYGFLCWDEWDETTLADTVVSAGNRYGVRYDELAMFLIAGQEQRLAALEAKV